MKRSDTISLGEFRKMTKDMSDDAVIMIVAENAHNQALVAELYPCETSLDRQGVILLRGDTSDSVSFTEG
jgi:hypothetical protein